MSDPTVVQPPVPGQAGAGPASVSVAPPVQSPGAAQVQASGASPVQSMTGFASEDGDQAGLAFQMDARSVNGRSLDVRLRLPPGMERLEAELRPMIGAAFRRGTIQIALSIKRPETAGHYTINRPQLDAYIEVIQDLASFGAVAAPRADGLLALKGVLEAAGEENATLLPETALAAAKRLVAALEANRREEGARLVPVVLAQLAEMERLGAAIDAHPERALPAVKARLDRQLTGLLDGQPLNADRLHQEAAILATRADVREELDRLTAHIAASRALLAEGGPVGRKLDFLSQELNRETNTICAKAPHHAITALGLDLKVAVEQFREQVQNLE